MSVFEDNDILNNADVEIIKNGVEKLINYYDNFNGLNHIKNDKMYDMKGQELSNGDLVVVWNSLYGCWTFYIIEKICKNIIKAKWYYKNRNGQTLLSVGYSNLKPHYTLKVDANFINDFVNGLEL